MHPYIIDTSVCLNPSLNNGHKPSLKRLALHVLGCVNSASRHHFVADLFSRDSVACASGKLFTPYALVSLSPDSVKTGTAISGRLWKRGVS